MGLRSSFLLFLVLFWAPGLSAAGTEGRRISSVFLLPGGHVDLEARELTAPPAANAGSFERSGLGKWRWKAPSNPGLYTIHLTDLNGARVLNAFVQVPFERVKKGMLNGYRIGHYPNSAAKIYRRPEGFVEVTAENQDTWVSPSFQLKQFLCKQPGGFPKYLVLKSALLHKLEALLDQARASGQHWNSLVVMSGYRTPHYNRSLGNVKLSRHMYGDAADVYVDLAPADGSMDDLNKDGRVDVSDAFHLFDLARKTELAPGALKGGLGTYKANAYHGPFLHVDTRGTEARWGVPRPARLRQVDSSPRPQASPSS